MPNVLRLILVGFLTIVGLALVTLYVWEAVIARLGEPDQSLLYWYAPFLLFGLLALKTAWKLFSARSKNQQMTHNDPGS